MNLIDWLHNPANEKVLHDIEICFEVYNHFKLSANVKDIHNVTSGRRDELRVSLENLKHTVGLSRIEFSNESSNTLGVQVKYTMDNNHSTVRVPFFTVNVETKSITSIDGKIIFLPAMVILPDGSMYTDAELEENEFQLSTISPVFSYIVDHYKNVRVAQ